MGSMAMKWVDDVGDMRLVLFTLNSPSLIEVSDTFYTRREGTSRGGDSFQLGRYSFYYARSSETEGIVLWSVTRIRRSADHDGVRE